MALDSDDEARLAANLIATDVASGRTDAADVFVAIYSDPSDQMRIGRHLGPILVRAVTLWREGDRSPDTMRLVALANRVREERDAIETSDAIAKAELSAERRAATLAAIAAPPDLAGRMTISGPHGVPLPNDATSADGFLATCVAAPEPLMAFYIAHLRSDGWALDLENSRPTTVNGSPPQCYFSSPRLPGRYLAILIAPDAGRPDGSRLRISEHED